MKFVDFLLVYLTVLSLFNIPICKSQFGPGLGLGFGGGYGRGFGGGIGTGFGPAYGPVFGPGLGGYGRPYGYGSRFGPGYTIPGFYPYYRRYYGGGLIYGR